MRNQPIVEILAFTDPVCTWCWGNEPVMRKLSTWYGSGLNVRYVMGGLVEDIRTFHDRANDIGGDPRVANAQIARHWLEASERHGMPVQTEGLRLFTAQTVSTYPQNIAFKAAELTNPGLAARYLRRLREAAAAEAQEIGRREVLIELAGEVGLDIAALIGHLNDGSADAAFRQDLETTRRYGVRSFPTFVLRHGEREVTLRGSQTFATMQAVIDTLSDGLLKTQAPERSPNNLLAFVQKHGRAAPVELATVFDLEPEALGTMLAGLKDAGLIRQVIAGNGSFLEPVMTIGCDVASGSCST